jgi:NAD+ synthase (glutamine-hydrolysing)
MRLALAQLDALIGDLEGNAERILRAGLQAAEQGAELLLTPELSLWGYPPRDLLLRPALVERQNDGLQALADGLPPGMVALVGVAEPVPDGGSPGLWNAVALVRGGAGWHVAARKRLLPSYDVFDESRYFLPGQRPALMELGQRPGSGPWRLGLTICEDLWVEQDLQALRVAGVDPIGELAELGVDLLLNLSASPYGRGKLALRRQLGQRAASRAGCPLVYVNQVGGNDELVFDGASFVVDADGTLLGQGPVCKEALLLWDAGDPRGSWRQLPLDGGSQGAGPSARPAAGARRQTQPEASSTITAATSSVGSRGVGGVAEGEPGVAPPLAVPSEMEQLLRALVLGVGDYARKCGFQGALLGLSGGIDSALVAVIAAAALGADRVKALRLPSPWSSQGSLDDAQALADRLGLDLQTLPIASLMQGFDQALAPVLGQEPSGVTAENLQSRIRGTLLMALANQQGRLLLSTGNKSELAVGYCTLYGDMNGGLAVIGDLYKTTVFALCDWIDSPESAGCRQDLGLPAEGELIGRAIRSKPPSAELRPDQKDSDSLPDYAVLDPLLRRIIEAMQTPEQLIAEGADPALAERVQGLLRRAEFKRRQAPPVLKISSRSFGGGWRMPIAAAG